MSWTSFGSRGGDNTDVWRYLESKCCTLNAEIVPLIKERTVGTEASHLCGFANRNGLQGTPYPIIRLWPG